MSVFLGFVCTISSEPLNLFQANLVNSMVVSNDYHKLCCHAKRLVYYVYIFDTIKQDQDGFNLTLLKTVWQSTNHGLLKY